MTAYPAQLTQLAGKIATEILPARDPRAEEKRLENLSLVVEALRKERNHYKSQASRLAEKEKKLLVKQKNHLQRELEKEKTRRKRNRMRTEGTEVEEQIRSALLAKEIKTDGNSSGAFIYTCNSCNISTIGEVPMLAHLAGRQHAKKSGKTVSETPTRLILDALGDKTLTSEKKYGGVVYSCTLCCTEVSGVSNAEAHLVGKAHAKVVRTIDKMASLSMTAEGAWTDWLWPTGTTETVNKVGATADNASSLLQGMSGLISSLQTTLGSLASAFKLPDGVNLVGMVFNFIMLVRAAKAGNKLDIILAVAGLAVDFGVTYSDVIDAISNFSDAFSAKPPTPPTQPVVPPTITVVNVGASTFRCTRTNSRMQTEGLEDFFSSEYTWLAGVLMTLVTVAIRGKDINYGSIMTHLSDFGRAAIGFTKVKDMLDWAVSFIKNQLSLYQTGKTLEQKRLENDYPQIENVIKAVELFKKMNPKYLDQDKQICLLAAQTQKLLDEYNLLALRAGDRKARSIITMHISSMQRIIDRAVNSPAHIVSSRARPSTLWIYGKAGVGKSVLCTYLEHLLFSEYLVSTGASPSDFVFTRSCENEYWEGYHNQPIVKYDDILQAVDSKSKENPEVLEIIRVVNEAAFHLHMADLADKKNTYFDSRFVIANSNTKVPKPQSITHPEAFLRRWDIAIEVRCNALFADSVTQKIDHAKLAAYRTANGIRQAEFVKELYVIDVYNIRNGNVLKSGLTLDAFWDIYKHKINDVETESVGLRRSIERFTGIQKDTDPYDIIGLRDSLSKLLQDRTIDLAVATQLSRADYAAGVPDELRNADGTVKCECLSCNPRQFAEKSAFETHKGKATLAIPLKSEQAAELRRALAAKSDLTSIPSTSGAVSPATTSSLLSDEEVSARIDSFKTLYEEKRSEPQSDPLQFGPGFFSGPPSVVDEGVVDAAEFEDCIADVQYDSLREQVEDNPEMTIEGGEIPDLDLDATDDVTQLESEAADAQLDALLSEEEEEQPPAHISARWLNYLDSLAPRLARIRKFLCSGVTTLVTGTLSLGYRVLSFIVGLFDSAAVRTSQMLGISAEYTKFIKVGMMVLTTWLGAFAWSKVRKCPFALVKTFTDFKNLNPCACSWCETHWRVNLVQDTTPVGSVAHGVGFLRYLSRNDPDPKWKEMFASLSSKLQAESAETKTVRARTHVYAETSKKSTPSEEALSLSQRARRSLAALVPMYTSNSKEDSPRLVAEIGDVMQLERHQSITTKNAVRLTADTSGKMNAAFVTGRTLLVPSHFLRSVVSEFTVQNPYNPVTTVVKLADCKISQLTDSTGKLVDLVFVTLSNKVPARPNLITAFASANALGKIQEGEICVSGFREVAGRLSLFDFHSPAFEWFTREKEYDNKAKTEVYRAHHSVWYEVNTGPGDCGSLVYVKNPRITGKLVGMHVAGNNGLGMAITITEEFLRRNLEAHVQKHSLDTRAIVDARVPFTTEGFDAAVASETPVDTLASAGDCLTLGTLRQPFVSTKTQIRPSAIHGTFTPTMAPSHLRPFRNESGFVDPLRKGIQKVLGEQPNVDMELVDIAVNDVAQVHDTTDTRRVLTYEEAVVGVPGEEYFTPINRRTSPGYPYNLDNPKQGKKHWFGEDDEYIINEDVRTDVEELLDHCRNGRRGDVVYIATLKDERRALEKVRAGKTRVFEAAPMHYVIAVRMYFMAFISCVMTRRISNEVSVGIDPFSIEWTRMAHWLQRYGRGCIAGDFSNFDGSLLQEILWKLCDLINDWYDDGEENKKIRIVLWEELCNSRVLVDGELIQQTHSQPSGNPLTVIINSLYNQVIMRVAYLECKRRAGYPLVCDFRDCVGLQCYGDDNVLNVSKGVQKWFNQRTITEALKTVGATYTDEAKSGEVVDMRELSNVSYLKRRFVEDEGHYWAPLELSVVKEMTNWIHGDDRKFATEENVKSALHELAQHGPQVYGELSKVLRAACKEAKLQVRFPSWLEYEREARGDPYLQ